MSAFLKSPSVTVQNGSKIVQLSGGVNASFVAPGTAVIITANDGSRYDIAEGVSGAAADSSGNSIITLREDWAYPTVTDGKLTAFNTIEGLRDAIRRAREISAEASLLTTAFSDVFTSTDETITIVVNGQNITVTPYQYLTQQATELISDLENATLLFSDLETAVQNLTTDVAGQQAIVDANLASSNSAASAAEGYAITADNAATAAQGFASSASSSETVATNKAAEATAAATAATNSASTATTKAAEAAASATSASTSETTATAKAAEATAAATSATSSESTATTKAAEATAAATSASTSEATATGKAAEATAAATSAISSETVATAKAAESQAWADTAVDTEVSPGQFSAKHYALKAEEWATIAQAAAGTVTGSLSFNGDHSAASNALPPTPENGSALYRITAAGTAGGLSLVAGDFIIYDPSAELWRKLQRELAINEVTGLTAALAAKASASALDTLALVVGNQADDIGDNAGAIASLNTGLNDLAQTVSELPVASQQLQINRNYILALAGL